MLIVPVRTALISVGIVTHTPALLLFPSELSLSRKSNSQFTRGLLDRMGHALLHQSLSLHDKNSSTSVIFTKI